jgi:deoxycytidine triphosphate deaminase
MNMQKTGDQVPPSEGPSRNEVPNGHLLSGETLMHVLRDAEHVFLPGSWSEENVRGAGYDLRLAGDCLVYPASGAERHYIDVDSSSPEVPKFALAPGDAALISTIERFSFDFDIAGTIGSKFFLASKGLLMLNGNAVHPGYGRRFDLRSRSWQPEDNVRLHFVVVNVGPEDVEMKKGEPIAHLQFYAVSADASHINARNPRFEDLRDRLFGRGSIYFRAIQDLKVEFKDAKGQLDKIKATTDTHDTAIGRMTEVQSLIIVFGVYLISATLLGVVLTSLVNVVEKLPARLSTGRQLLVIILASVYGVCCIAGVIAVVAVIFPVIRRMAKRS